MLLALKPQAGIVLVFEIERTYTNVALLDLTARILSQSTITYSPGHPPEDVLNDAVAAIRSLTESEGIAADSFLGIGIAIPGIIDYDKGIVREARTLSHWCDFPVRRAVEIEFGVPVFVENDVKSLTFGEFQYGAGRTVRDLVTVWVGDGIGAGIIINGRLLRGASSSAGEIEFNSFANFNGEEDRIDLIRAEHVKDWGDVLTHQRLLDSVKRAIGNGKETSLSPDASIAQVVRAAEENDPLAYTLLRQFGWVLGTMCSNLIHTLNPPMLLLSGPLFDSTDIVMEGVKDRISKDILRTPLEVAVVKKGSLKNNAVIIGAASLVLDDFFQVPDHWVKSRSRTALLQMHAGTA